MQGATIAGKYQMGRLIGHGGMGAVYEARNLSTLKRCAVKVLLAAEVGQDMDLVKRFFREARASSVIESDNIVQVYDSEIDPDHGPGLRLRGRSRSRLAVHGHGAFER
jgi:serine/threonine protein kinase